MSSIMSRHAWALRIATRGHGLHKIPNLGIYELQARFAHALRYGSKRYASLEW